MIEGISRSSDRSAAAAEATTGLTVYGCERDEALLFAELAPALGVAPTISESPLSAQSVGLADGNRCVSISHRTPVADATLLALSEAGVAHLTTRSIGTNHLDVRYAESVGISVSTVAYSPDSVADYTLLLMLALLRGAGPAIRRADAGDYRLPAARGRELRDLTVGVIGAGRIGAAVIDRLRGFGPRVLVCDRRAGATVGAVALDDLLCGSDLVTLHAPLSAETHHLLDRRRIEGMRQGAYVVNTGRGPLLDTAALLDALESGRLGGAALDVLEGEEGVFYADRRGGGVENAHLSRLRRLPNVLVSPHVAYFTDRALRDVVEGTLLDCLGFEGRDRWRG